jgi:hypothetical protein
LPGIGITSEYLVPPHPLPQQHFYGEVCDPEVYAPAASPLHRAFLSDDVVPVAQPDGDTSYGAEISDHD